MTERGILIIIGLVLKPHELDFYQSWSYADATLVKLLLSFQLQIGFKSLKNPMEISGDTGA